MISLPSIILIDDNKDDLESLQDSFIKVGYPCFPILYKNDSENDSGVDHVNLSMIKPRVIITDLNLQELQIDAKTLVGPIALVLKKLAIKGPYLLYFWSKNKEHVEEVMKLIFKRYEEEIEFPLHWGVLDKTEFKHKPEELKEKIANLLTENPIFNALFTWENRVSSAAQATTNSLFQLAKPESRNDIPEFQAAIKEKIQIMLSVIGNEAIGVKNAGGEPGLAIELGLEPVLHDHIQSSYEAINNDSTWCQAANHIGTRLNPQSYSDVKAHLNSFYHIEKINKEHPKNKRGTWISFSNDYLKNSENKPKIEKNLGRGIKKVINEEFVNLNEDGFEEQKESIYENTKIGFIELSAECDQAQRKTKLNRYFLSAMIPFEYEKYTLFDGKRKRPTAHAGIYRLPNITLDGREYIIKISFMYQVGAIPDFNKWLGEPVFRLKDQILSDISFRASQHLTRPGIIRFD